MTQGRVGIIGIEYQLPKFVLKQEEVSEALEIDVNKLKIGLGLEEFSVPDLNEDCVSLAMSAVSKLLKKMNINKEDVGKIEVGSESNFDFSKSIKSYLLDLFPTNTSISGCDNVHACYGGTNALLNSLAWLESSICTKKYAIVVCTDVCFYRENSAIPTSGAGAVAMLLGRDPVLALIPDVLFHYSSNESDFLKPISKYPFPVLKGKESVENYMSAFSHLYKNCKIDYNYIVFHTPYPKLIQKLCANFDINESKYASALLSSKRNGNSYTASLYFCLISLLNSSKLKINDRVLMYSFGSGCVSSLLCFEKVREGCEVINFEQNLSKRIEISFSQYIKIINNAGVASTQSICEEENDNERYKIVKIEGDVRYYSQ
jgi:hydroxymethylglutaryl-CoA synthase